MSGQEEVFRAAVRKYATGIGVDCKMTGVRGLLLNPQTPGISRENRDFWGGLKMKQMLEILRNDPQNFSVDHSKQTYRVLSPPPSVHASSNAHIGAASSQATMNRGVEPSQPTRSTAPSSGFAQGSIRRRLDISERSEFDLLESALPSSLRDEWKSFTPLQRTTLRDIQMDLERLVVYSFSGTG